MPLPGDPDPWTCPTCQNANRGRPRCPWCGRPRIVSAIIDEDQFRAAMRDPKKKAFSDQAKAYWKKAQPEE